MASEKKDGLQKGPVALCRQERLDIVRREVGSGLAPSGKANRADKIREVESRKRSRIVAEQDEQVSERSRYRRS